MHVYKNYFINKIIYNVINSPDGNSCTTYESYALDVHKDT